MTDTPLPKLGIRLDGAMTPRACVARAVSAEAAGLDRVWFAENAFARGILPAAAACAVATDRIGIVAGVFNPFARHPTMMAMEIGALDELAGGRAAISIGSGIGSAVEKIGGAADRPLVALRETHAILAGMLRGENVTVEGERMTATGVRLGYRARPGIEIFVAGRGDLTLKFSGAAADGLIISNMCSRGYSRRAHAIAADARAEAGRDGPPVLVQYMPAAVRTDRDEALALAKRAVGALLPNFWGLASRVPSAKLALSEGTGLEDAAFEAVVARLKAGEDPAEAVDTRLALAFAIGGTPEEALEQAAAYRAAGVAELALTFDDSAPETDAALLGQALAARGRAWT